MGRILLMRSVRIGVTSWIEWLKLVQFLCCCMACVCHSIRQEYARRSGTFRPPYANNAGVCASAALIKRYVGE
jgi:hypothetical protein